MEPRPTPKYVFRNGNILSFRVSNKSKESETLSFQHSLDEIPLHNLERRFSAMKAKVDNKKELLMAKMKTEQLTGEEEEWLDGGGNLVEELMLIDCLKEIEPNNQHISITAKDLKIINKINEYKIEESSVKKITSDPKKSTVSNPKNLPVCNPKSSNFSNPKTSTIPNPKDLTVSNPKNLTVSNPTKSTVSTTSAKKKTCPTPLQQKIRSPLSRS
jgi:hypothetical protein